MSPYDDLNHLMSTYVTLFWAVPTQGNHLLWRVEIFINNLHLFRRKNALVMGISRFIQVLKQKSVSADPSIEGSQCGFASNVGHIGLCQFGARHSASFWEIDHDDKFEGLINLHLAIFA